MVTAQYLDGKSFVGSRQHYACGVRVAGVSHSAYWPHIAYFCPSCGEIWGRMIYSYHFDYSPLVPAAWVVEARPCVKHGDGQFLVGLADEQFDHCSPDLLAREILALIEGYDK